MKDNKGHTPGDVTQLLADVRCGDRGAFDRLLAAVYDELKRVAQRQMRKEREGHTLNTTGLVHEAYLKLVDQTQVEWKDRVHFFGIASRAMRQILVDHARRRSAQKRGGSWQQTTLEPGELPAEMPAEEVLALDDALERLDQLDERLRQVVEYRFFGEMTEEEIAEALGMTTRTVQRDWVKARAWLYKELYPNPREP
jgi:RNA polymerase sigma factor (TIGR02999 family)